MNICRFLIVVLTTAVLLVWTSMFGIYYWLGHEDMPFLINKIKNHQEYDFIIVGAGTAGCVLASLLSANSNYTILLIEAGSTFGPLSIVPITTTILQGSISDWSFKTIPQKYSSKGLYDKRQSIPRGKGLGGSSQINYMLHDDGDLADFELWEKKFGKLLNVADSSEFNCETEPDVNNANTCTVEALRIIQKTKEIVDFSVLSDSKLSTAFLEAGFELERDELRVKFDLAKYNIKNGVRHGVFQKYLRPSFHRPNLHILIETIVHKILFNHNHYATSVVISSATYPKDLTIIKAKYEIILSAGAIQSPQILKLSGIGPVAELQSFDIPVIHNSPLVGENLFDHANLPIYVSMNEPESVTKHKVLDYHEWLKYLQDGRGVLSNTGVVGVGKLVDDDSGTVLFGVGTVDEKALRKIANFRPKTFKSFFPFHYNTTKEGFIFLNTCFYPKSRGTIKLKRRNIFEAPLIDPNYFSESADVQCIIRAIRFSVKIYLTQSFHRIGAQRIHWPKLQPCSKYGPNSNDFLTNNPSDEYLECIIRYGALTGHHPGGTCAYGRDSSTVVDEELRVRGVSGLRIVDGSVLPHPIRGTPNSLIIRIAEQASLLIQNNYS